jgi:hypothetical protein
MYPPKLSRHARQRLQQRGGRRKEVGIVTAYGDIEVPAENGCRFLRLSNRAAALILQGAGYPVQDVDRARRLIVLVSSTGEVVTVIKRGPERRFPRRREYRR